MSNMTEQIGHLLDTELTRIVQGRERTAGELRNLHDALVQARVGANALRGIGIESTMLVREAPLLERQENLDSDVRELIAELAGLFVEEAGATVTVEVAVMQDPFTATKLIDLAAQKIVARWKESGDLLPAAVDESMRAWLKTFEKAIQKHMTDPEAGL